MRPFFFTVLMAVSLIVMGLVTSVCFAQEESDGARKVVSRVAPVYPELASKWQITGTVKVAVVITPNGKVKSAQVVGGHPVLAKAALDAVEQWKFGPAPEESKESIELHFHP